MNVRIAIIGVGKVGLATAQVYSHNATLTLFDLKKRIPQIKRDLTHLNTALVRVTSSEMILLRNDVFFFCLPTDYNQSVSDLDTDILFHYLYLLQEHRRLHQRYSKPTVIIRSTLPFYAVTKLEEFKNTLNVYYMPEFFTEGNELEQSLKPNQLVIGTEASGKWLKSFIKQCTTLDRNIPLYFTTLKEAVLVKLAMNTYLSMRIAFFNELASFAADQDGIHIPTVIGLMGKDSRIGSRYNNPSFGFGGYCLPKDTLSLANAFYSYNNVLIKNIPKSNDHLFQSIVDEIVRYHPIFKSDGTKTVIGVYKLGNKKGSDNPKGSVSLRLAKALQDKDYELLVYDPEHEKNKAFSHLTFSYELIAFKEKCDLILANRIDQNLKGVENKLFTRDAGLLDI